MSFKPDYRAYSYEELLDVYNNVDREAYPHRFQEVCDVMEEKGLLVKAGGSSHKLVEAPEIEDVVAEDEPVPGYTKEPPVPQYDNEGNYMPNSIPIKDRIINAVFSSSIIAYGGYGLHVNELWVPIGKRTSIMLTDFSAKLMFVAIVCVSIMMLAEVVDHYDKRDNEHTYYKVAVWFKYLGYGTFGLAVVMGIAMGAPID